jgi:hypothetical protein
MGIFDEDKTSGFGSYHFSSGAVIEGVFSPDGYLQSEGCVRYANGIKYKGRFKDSLKHGDGVLSFEDGSLYSGEISHDFRAGHGVMDFVNGTKYEGIWLDDLYHGLGKLSYNTGQIYTGFFFLFFYKKI